MKKSLLFISALIAGASSGFAQDTIPNANFDRWTTTGSIDNPDNWLSLNGKSFIAKYNNNPLTQVLADTTVVKATMAMNIEGSNTVAIKTTSQSGSALPGVLASCDSIFVDTVNITSLSPLTVDGSPRVEFFGGIAVSSRPATLNGMWRYVAKGAMDSASVNVLFTKVNGSSVDTVGAGNLFIDSVAGANWADFTCPITWQDPQGNPTTATPDNAVIIFTSSSSTMNAVVGSTLYADSLAFTFPIALNCVVDPATPTSGTALAILPDTSVVMIKTPGEAFTQTFSMWIPSAFSMQAMGFNVTGTIDSVKVDGVSGIPGTWTVECGTPDCVALSNAQYCFTVTGTMPTQNDILYNLAIMTSPYGFLDSAIVALAAGAGLPIDPKIEANVQSTAFASYDVKVGNPVGIEDFSAGGTFDVSGNYPNPFDISTTINFNTSVSGNVEFVVVDVLGRQVYNTNITASAGTNTFTYTTDLESGTYFFSLSDGTNTVTKKIVVSK